MTRGRNTARRSPSATLGGGPAPADRGAPAVFPVPSILDGRPYILSASEGPSDEAYVERGPTSGRMKVPVGTTTADRRIRLHEMAHVRWTPPGIDLPDGVSFKTINAIEDRRCHKRLGEIGYADVLDAPIFNREQLGVIQSKLETARQIAAGEIDPGTYNPFKPIEIARMIAASDLTSESWRIRDMVDGAGFGWVRTITDTVMKRNRLDARRPAFKRTIEAAIELEDAFREMEHVPEGMRQKFPQYTGDPGSGAWGEMEIRVREMPDRLPRSIATRRRFATDTGAVPRNWNRLASDGRVFTRKRNRPAGGTVLIDQSGSMSLCPDEVMALIEAFPGVTIATYAGSDNRGILYIIARDGRRATPADCQHPMGGNIIDGPALDWLCQQPGPRVWVSDGYVTGRRDKGSDPALLIDAGRKVAAGRIKQFDRLGALIPAGMGGPQD